MSRLAQASLKTLARLGFQSPRVAVGRLGITSESALKDPRKLVARCAHNASGQRGGGFEATEAGGRNLAMATAEKQKRSSCSGL